MMYVSEYILLYIIIIIANYVDNNYYFLSILFTRQEEMFVAFNQWGSYN